MITDNNIYWTISIIMFIFMVIGAFVLVDLWVIVGCFITGIFFSFMIKEEEIDNRQRRPKDN